MKNDAVGKVAKLQRSTPEEITKRDGPPHMPVINSIDHYIAVPCPVKLPWINQPFKPIDHSSVGSESREFESHPGMKLPIYKTSLLDPPPPPKK